MKIKLFINQYSGPDVILRDKILASQMAVQVIDVMTQDDPNKGDIRTTPALVIIRDDLQGEFLTKPGVDPVTIIEAIINEQRDIEEDIVYGKQNHRLDSYVVMKQNEAVDEVTVELINGGVL